MDSRLIAKYSRVSTDEQAREGVSLDEQDERLSAYCKAVAWSEDSVSYVDDGYSAKDMDRPELNKLIEDIKNKKISKVLVTKLDRLSRRLLDLLHVIDFFQEHEVAFVSVSESFDTNNPSGRLTLQVLGAVAEFERERIRERVYENMLHAAGTGKWLTQSPYGYKLEEKLLVIDDKEANVVRRVFETYLVNGGGFFSIAKMLNDEGIPSRHNKEWSIRSVKLMLQNPVYMGTLVWNRIDSSKKKRKPKAEIDWIIVENSLPVIIEKGIWEKVKQKMKNRPPIASRAQTSPHLLGGILKCGQCGSGMSIGYSGSTNSRYRVYRCSAYKNKGTCTSKQYRADEVENWFKQGILRLFDGDHGKIILSFKEQFVQSKKVSYEQKIHNAKTRYKRKVEAYTAGLIEINDLNEEKKKLDEITQEFEKQSQNHEEPYDIEELEKLVRLKIQNVMNAIELLSVEEAKLLLHTIIEKVTINEEKNIDIQLVDFSLD